MALFECLEIWVTNFVGQKLIFTLRLKVFGHVQRLPLPFHDRNPVGRLLIRVTNDVENLNELFTSGLVAALADLLLIAGVLAMMFAISWKLALATLAPAPLTLLAVLVFRTVARRQYREVRVKIARLNAFLNESVNGMRTIQMFTREGQFLKQVRVTNEGSTVVPVPAGFAFSPDQDQQFLYVVDSGPMRVVIFDRRTMTQVGVVGTKGTHAGEFDIVHHMAVDSRGNLYTAEIVNNRRAQKFVLAGTR